MRITTSFIFDTLNIQPDNCLEIELNTGRYNTRQLLLRPGTDLSNVLTPTIPHNFRKHEILITMLSKQATKVTFKDVPISVRAGLC